MVGVLIDNRLGRTCRRRSQRALRLPWAWRRVVALAPLPKGDPICLLHGHQEHHTRRMTILETDLEMDEAS